MEANPRKALNQLMKGLEAMNTEQEAPTKALFNLLGAVYAHDSALGVKVKELISVGIAVKIRCEYCVVYHVYKALEAGAKRGEIMESAMIAVAMGGASAMTYASTLVRNCLDEFESDFQG
jgi:AhpD family alkylhydroperoxidase